jgi:protein TonB
MTPRTFALAALAAFVAAGCAQKPLPSAAPPPSAASAPAESAVAPQAAQPGIPPRIPALTLDGYKKEVATRIAAQSQHLFTDPIPEMLKAVVVLDITIDRDGNVARVAVRRSNGYRQLEERAIASVRVAAPFGAPSSLARSGEGSVSFLETFLFRDDGRFQIRSLVAPNP